MIKAIKPQSSNLKSGKSGKSDKSAVQTVFLGIPESTLSDWEAYMINNQYKYSELTSKIIGCAMTVHKTLGNGFQEVIYQRALGIEFDGNGIEYHREHEMPIYYKQRQIGTRRVDFLVKNTILVEIKALSKLEDVHLAQAINYLEAYNLEVGLLINFGAKSLEFKRLINSKFDKVT